ncbi:SMP-30/gluconolactonase/LRE family protein [Paenibacillus thalictri]|uniref:SMP-30/gluconolactonase/LRE family protein n=1 Tax=Paenibacillus thalictri TaxID=2527873 RepID=A0A4Q9DHY9_9BACL|nr:SMP-30/gluconolactonase/LRE family protein [Paenibacillus thalictri]TBL72686.1 SMP-30/gluconolactonase/LRE family protein [Paenibacillus thalictri]
MESVELVVDAKATLGEGPCWDEQAGKLLWVDIVEKRVHIHDPASGSNRVIQLDQEIGAVVPRTGGGLMVVLRNGFYALDLETEQLQQIVDPEADQPGNRFNDGKCDPKGRFWAGTMDLKEKVKEAGKLYCLNVDGSLRTMEVNVTTSNGLGWSPDHKVMYYIDSPTKQVAAYDYDVATGSISNKRIVVELGEGEGFPDGMTVDEEGMLWVAQWGGFKVSRWNPQTGERLSYIPVPAARASSCAFGGENRDELYITTARTGNDEEYPLAGGVFRVKPGVRGLPTYSYGG